MEDLKAMLNDTMKLGYHSVEGVCCLLYKSQMHHDCFDLIPTLGANQYKRHCTKSNLPSQQTNTPFLHSFDHFSKRIWFLLSGSM